MTKTRWRAKAHLIYRIENAMISESSGSTKDSAMLNKTAWKSFIRFIEKESLLFFSLILFSCIIVPTLSMLLMVLFTDIPRNESLSQAYRYLYTSSGESRALGYLVAFGPYLVFQGIRSVRWVRARKTEVGSQRSEV